MNPLCMDRFRLSSPKESQLGRCRYVFRLIHLNQDRTAGTDHHIPAALSSSQGVMHCTWPQFEQNTKLTWGGKNKINKQLQNGLEQNDIHN